MPLELVEPPAGYAAPHCEGASPMWKGSATETATEPAGGLQPDVYGAKKPEPLPSKLFSASSASIRQYFRGSTGDW